VENLALLITAEINCLLLELRLKSRIDHLRYAGVHNYSCRILMYVYKVHSKITPSIIFF